MKKRKQPRKGKKRVKKLDKRSKSTPGAKIKKSLWKVFSEYIRQRDGGICISCGKKDFWRKMDAGHYIPKTAGLMLYFDERNVNCQCTYCNRWMHGNLTKYAIALREKYGETILEELDKKRKEFKKISIPEYQKMIEEYKTKIQELKTKPAKLIRVNFGWYKGEIVKLKEYNEKSNLNRR